MTACAIVVIGHVDHGKTSLLYALTGIQTDRLPEEKARGVSIQPGFAYRSYASGVIDFIDAPGHADFIAAMVAGASGANAALVVISAVEGVGAQTREHLCIADLLGIRNGVIAVSKSDLLSAPEQAAQLEQIRRDLSETAMADAPMVLCSAHRGDGIDDLHAALEAMAQTAGPAAAPLNGFLPIDRVFSRPGHGTIVTGTLLGQGFLTEQAVTLHPGPHTTTLRGLQCRGAARARVQPGERVAANLRGIAAGDIPRGAVLCAMDAGAPSYNIDVHLRVLDGPNRAVKHMQELRVLFGTTSAVAQVRMSQGGRIGAGQTGYAQLRFRQPVMGFAGQPAVLRSLSPPETLGGAVILDPEATPAGAGKAARLAVLQAAQAQDGDAVLTALSAALGGVAPLGDLARLWRRTPESARAALRVPFDTLDGDLLAPKQSVVSGCRAALEALAAYHAQNPLHVAAPRAAIAPRGMSPALLRHIETTLLAQGQICRLGTDLALAGHDPVALLDGDQRHRMTQIETARRDAGLNAVALETFGAGSLDKALIGLLLGRARLVALRNVALKQTLVFHADALVAAGAQLRAAFPAPQGFTTSQARTALGTNRRIIVPLLEHFDQNGLTTRTGDLRHITSANSVSPQVRDG